MKLRLAVFLPVVLGLFGCRTPPSDSSLDSADTDADSDADTDADSDADTDADSDADTGVAAHTVVAMTTTLGAITLDINGVDAPITAANFLDYVDRGFYDGRDGFDATIFHRVVSGFVVQGGGYTADGTAKATLPPITLETDVGLSNVRGSIAMARTNRPDSATSQFYINLVDNLALDGTGNRDGYAVFGTVTAGMDVVDAVGASDVDSVDQPLTDVVILSCQVVE